MFTFDIQIKRSGLKVSNSKVFSSPESIKFNKLLVWLIDSNNSKNVFRKLSLKSGVWSDVDVDGSRSPSERYGHSVVTHDNKIYMYGGVMRSGHVSKVGPFVSLKDKFKFFLTNVIEVSNDSPIVQIVI